MTTCPNPEIHGNPFRYCPSCDWKEELPTDLLDRLELRSDPTSRDAFDEVVRLRAAVAMLTENADRMVQAIKWMLQPTDGDDTHDTLFGIWQAANESVLAYEQYKASL